MARLALAWLLAALLAPGAQAAALRAGDAGTIGQDVSSDGRTLLAGRSGDGAVTVLDVTTGNRGEIDSPGGCTFADIGTGGILLWSCYAGSPFDYGLTYDLGTGVGTEIPAPAPPPGTTPDDSSYAQIGRRWVRARFDGGNRPFDVYIDRVTGRSLRPGARLRRRTLDLDRPALARPLCRGMALPLIPDDDDGVLLEPGPLSIASPYAAATTYGSSSARVVLQRCGRKQQTLSTCRRGTACSQPVIDDRNVAWIERHEGHGSRLRVRSLRTAVVRSLDLGRPAVAPTVLLVAHRLFVAINGRLLRVAL